VEEGLRQERKWKVATVRGEDGRDLDVWAYGRTFEEARRRAAAGDPRVYYRRAQSWWRDSLREE
jgi:hypothetical protein